MITVLGLVLCEHRNGKAVTATIVLSPKASKIDIIDNFINHNDSSDDHDDKRYLELLFFHYFIIMIVIFIIMIVIISAGVLVIVITADCL